MTSLSDETSSFFSDETSPEGEGREGEKRAEASPGFGGVEEDGAQSENRMEQNLDVVKQNNESCVIVLDAGCANYV